MHADHCAGMPVLVSFALYDRWVDDYVGSFGRVLIDSGARLDVKDAAGKTPLDALAAKAGGRDTPANEQMVKLIRSAAGG